MKNLVVFASGSGSNFQSIIDAISNGKLEANIVGLITNNSSAYAIQRANENSIPVLVISPNDFESENEYCEALLKVLKHWKTDVLILAGYLRKIPIDIIETYKNKIINMHPSLLPKYGGKGFYGIKVHKAVIENNETESGCTVHIVTEEYDKGPILGQAKTKVLASDTAETLSKRVLALEHKLFPKEINKHLKKINK